MNYLAALLGLALMGAVTTAAIYRGDSISWKAKYDSRVAQEQTAAQKAKDDAAAQEKKDLDAFNLQSSQAILQAQSKAEQSQQQLKLYQQKLAEASQAKDLPHLCSNQPIPPELIPSQ